MDHEALHRAQAALEIRDVYPRGETFALNADTVPTLSLPETNASYRFRVRPSQTLVGTPMNGEGQPDRFIEFVFSGEVTLRKAGRSLSEEPDSNGTGTDDLVAQLQVEFGVLYQLKIADDLAEPDLLEFSRHNVPLHAIPYFREHVTIAFQRRGFPQVTIPMHRPLPKPSEGDSGSSK